MPDTHLLEASLEKKAQPALRLSWLLPLIVLVLGLAMTVAAWREAQLVAHQEIQRDFDYQVRRITHLGFHARPHRRRPWRFCTLYRNAAAGGKLPRHPGHRDRRADPAGRT
jgi:hypothetical protein